MFDQFDDNTPQSDLDYAHEKECFDIEHERNTEVCAGLSAGVEGRSIDDAVIKFIYT